MGLKTLLQLNLAVAAPANKPMCSVTERSPLCVGLAGGRNVCFGWEADFSHHGRCTVMYCKRASGLPFTTITWDNGTEFHGYRALEHAAGIRCYFAYPHHPWERGSNENFNGLLRQYFPKGKSLARIRQADCTAVVAKLNQRPRKRYGFQSPEQQLQQTSGVLHLEC